jgi:glycosyltransferase involved in cell wall biosynthesis
MTAPDRQSPRPPSHILITTDSVGGIWNYTLQLAKGLSSRGSDVLIAGLGPEPNASQWREIQATPKVEFQHAPYRLEWMEDGLEDLASARGWLLSLESSFSPDIVHCNSYSLAAAPFGAPALVVAHSCVYSWWRAVHGEPPPANWTPYRDAVRAGLCSAAAVVAPSSAMLRSLVENYGESSLCSCVIHNGLPITDSHPGPKYPVILGAGRVWDESKNFAVLDEMALHIPWPIRIAGPVSSPDGCQAGQFRKLELLGPLPQDAMQAAMCQASVFVHPAVYEPFGLAVLEAAQRGCALVLSDIPSLREIWGDAALFCPPRDSRAWTSALTAISNSDDLRLELATKSRSRARQFTVDRMVSEYQGLYRRILPDCKREKQLERAS